MDTNLDTLIVALYVQVDDLFTLLGVRKGPGRPPRLTDSELVFPYLPQQSAYNKRLREACHLVAHAIRHLAGLTPSWCDQVRLLDSTPVPCGASLETVKRSELGGWAKYGYCAAHSRFFWGLRLYLLTAPDGLVVAWCLADPKMGEREVGQALLESAPIRLLQLIVADKGFAGREFEGFVPGLGATLVRPDRRDEDRRWGSLGWIRQRIESCSTLGQRGD